MTEEIPVPERWSGPVMGPGLGSRALAREAGLAVWWQPEIPACDLCPCTDHFTDRFCRLTEGGQGTVVLNLCGDCLDGIYGRIRAVVEAARSTSFYRQRAALTGEWKAILTERMKDQG